MKTMGKRSIFFIAVFITILISQQLFGTNGRITGEVVDNQTGDALPGANLVLKGTSMGASSDLNGRYVISNVPAGTYTLVVTYIGYNSVELPIRLTFDKDVNQKVEMTGVTISGQEVTVTAQAVGQKAAINQQLTSSNIANIVSSARIQELPDANAAESIGRLPGISLVRNGGQATQVVIRGLQPQYNAIMIDGVQIPANDAGSISTSGAYAMPTITAAGGRGVDLSMISSNSLEGIEVFKTVTPDMDASILGGAVNFDLKVAEGTLSGAPSISFLAQGAYNNLMSTYNEYKFVANVEKRFFNDRFGIFAQGIAQRQNLTSNQLGGTYRQPNRDDKPDEIVLGSLYLGFSPSRQERLDGTLTLDYKLPNGKLTLVNLVSHGKTNNETHSETYNLALYGDDIQFGTQLSSNKNNVITNILKYEQRIGSFKADVKLSNAYSDNRMPRAWKVVFDQLSAATGKIPGNLSPTQIADTAKGLIKLDKMFWQGNSIWSSYNKQNDTQGSVDLTSTINLSNKISLTLKSGGQYKYTTRYYNFDAGFGSLYSGSAAGL
jgi:TonB-dependent receptor